MKTKFYYLACLLLIQFAVKAQMKIGDNSTTINSASLLELETTNKGLVLPRVSIADVSAASPLPAGLLTGTVVYNTNAATTGGSGVGIYIWNGTKWVVLSTGTSVTSSAWLLTGNSGLSSSTNFIGTTDAIDLVAKTANIERMRILGAANGSSQPGWIGMGVTIPRSSLDVAGDYTNKNVLTLQNTSSTGYSSVDMLDNSGTLKGTFGYANSGTSANFANRLYFNTYGSDFLLTSNSGTSHFFMKGGTGYIGINTSTPSERLHVVGNIYLNGAFMPGGSAGTSGYVLTSAGANTSPVWTNSSSLGWALTGNNGTSYATNFLGTTDLVSMRFRTNNVQRMIIDSLGRVGIGINNPTYALSVLSQINPLYLSGVQATTTFSTDSILTINAGIVKKTPYASLTGNFWNTTGNAGTNYATNYIGTSDNISLRVRTNNIQRMIIDSVGSVAIGTSSFDPYNREKLLVDNGSSTSDNIATFKGNRDGFEQIEIQNTNSGTSASSDFVATADDGTDSTNYIDMGINSSTYAPGVENWGNQHDAYLYANSRNLLIGCNSTNSDVIFMVGGGKIKNNTALRIRGEDGVVVLGTGEGSSLPVGNIFRGPSPLNSAVNTAGGSLTITGGNSTGIATGGSLNIAGGATSGTGTGGSVNITGGGTSGGLSGSVNINITDSVATNINTGIAKGNVTVGGAANNILLPKYNTVGGLFYTSKATGQLANAGSKLLWDSINNRLSINTASPSTSLEVTANGTDNALRLHGVYAGDPNYDSILSISSTGVVGFLDPSTILTYRYWGKNGNIVNAKQFLGTTNNQALVFKFNSIQAGYLDDKNTQFGTSATIGAGNDNTVIGVSASAANGATAVGTKSVASGKDNTALGVTATASNSTQETAIGSSALANNQNNTAIGYNASAITNKNATAIGAGTSASGTNSTVIGANTKTTQDNAVIIGDATTQNLYVGIGTSTPSSKLDIIANGANNPLELHGVPTGSISSDNLLTINSSGVVGSVPQSTVSGAYWSLNGNAATSSSVLGTTNNQPLQFQYNNISAGAINNNNTSIGTSSSVGAGANNTALGFSASAANSATAVGASSIATFKDNTALGNGATANVSTQETVIGSSALANNQNNTAIGFNSSAITNKNATAIGAGTTASGTNSTVIGANAKTTQDNAVIIGDATTANLYVGIGTSTPSAKLDITATGAGNYPLELHGLSAGTYPTDNILSINSSGVVGYLSASTLGGNYILNQTTQQTSSNFNISGSGTVGGLLTSSGGYTNSGALTTSGGIVNINAGSNFATNINTGTSNGTVTIGGASNNVNFPKLSASSVVLTDASKNLTSSTPSTNTFLYYNGTNFSWQSSLPNAWSITGNSGTTAGTNFIGTTDNQDLVFKTNGTEAFRATTTNRIGIGTTTPSYVLSASGDANQTFGLERNTAGTFAGNDLTLKAGGAKAAQTNKTGGDLYLMSGLSTGTGNSNIYLQTATAGNSGAADNNPSTKMTILGSGNVGIGTTTPQSTLDIKGTLRLSAAAGASYVALQSANGPGSVTYTLPTADGSGGQVLSTNGSGILSWASALTTASGWSLTGNSGTTPGTNFVGTTDNKDLVFKTNNSEVFRATTTGRLGIGITTPSYVISTNGDVNQTFGMERNTTGDGNDLTIQAAGAKAAVGNKNGGDLYLKAGTSTGTGASDVYIQTSGNGSAGSADAVPSTRMAILGSGYVGIGTTTPSSILHVVGVASLGKSSSTTGGLTFYNATNNNAVNINSGTTSSTYSLTLPTAGPTATNQVLVNSGGGVLAWATVSNIGTSGAWMVTGNAGTNAASNFLGTTDLNALSFRVGNTQAGYLGLSGSSYATSFGVGSSGSSTGFQATAIGAGAQATANDAIALGYSSTASIQDGIAIGNSAKATTNNEAIAIGHNSTASAFQGIALGVSANASTNNQTIAIGNTANATGYQGIAIGYGADATTNSSALAVGVNTNATGYQSTAIGNGASATGQNSTAIGNGATTSQTNAFILGNSSANVGINTSTPNASAALDVNGSAKIGASGTVLKSIQAFATTINQSVAAGGATQVYATITIPTPLSSTQAVVTISPAFDLPAGIYIDDIHATSTTTVHLRFVNSTPSTVTVAGTFYVQIVEF